MQELHRQWIRKQRSTPRAVMAVLVSAVLILALATIAGRAQAQYMFLDSNGDGYNSEEDRLNPPGVPTQVTVYLATSYNGDWFDTVCSTGPEPLTLNSYTFILRAEGGTVAFGSFSNLQPSMSTSLGTRSSDTDYYTGRGGGTILEPGVYELGSITVTVMSEAPSLTIVQSTELGNGYRTSFGTQCAGQDQDNTYKLGTDWQDADGLLPPDLPPTLTAPSSLASQVGSEVTIQVDAVDSLSQFAPTITAQGYPLSLSLSVSQIGTNASRGVLSGRLGTTDAGTHNIVWTATDGGGLSSTGTTVMDVSSQTATTGATIVGYTESGPGPRTISQSSRGIDAILGPWGGPLFPNGPCGQLFGTGAGLDNRLIVEIDVGTGGAVSFTYEIEQTGTPFLNGALYVRLTYGAGVIEPISGFGNPAPCWGLVWKSRRLFKKISLNEYANQHVFLEFIVAGYDDGTETQGRFYSIAIDKCGEPPLSPMNADDQLFENEENHWDETRLTPAMHDGLNCLRTKVAQAGGQFDVTQGSAYRTPGYQAHLYEVWNKWERLNRKSFTDPDCQQLKDYVALEVGKHGHSLVREPAKDSKHSRGLAFDATITGVNQDSLACSCGLYRPLKNKTKKIRTYDPIHFQLLNGIPCPP